MILLYILIIKQVNREFCFWNFNKKITMNRNKYGNNTIIKRKGDVVKLIVIYPKFPLGNMVDPDWEEEYNMVSSMDGIETGLYDSEEKRLILKNVAEEAFFLYRGWMQREGEELPHLFQKYRWWSETEQIKMGNSSFYWTKVLEPFLIGPTYMYSNEMLNDLKIEFDLNSIEALAEKLYLVMSEKLGFSIFMKDGVKSAIRPVINSKEEMAEGLKEMINYTENFRDGLVFKPAVFVENERRFFCWKSGKIVGGFLVLPEIFENSTKEEEDFLIKIIETVDLELELNFFTLDIAYADGKLVLVELGHGEYSSLKETDTLMFAKKLEEISKSL